jgi:DNA-binding XRE family transcriptional regulator
MSKWEDLEKELLSDPATKREFDRLAPRYAVISGLIKARIRKKLTQAEIAKKIGTKQSAIARLESGSVNPSLEFLQKVAKVMGYKVMVHLSKI